MEVKVLIVGGGLSGLHTAYALDKAGIDYALVEARSRFGGRILSCNYDEEDYDPCKPSYDLGPAWFWPGQIQMQALVDELGLTDKVFLQYSKGDALFDNGSEVQRGINGISMQGSYRLSGGMGCLVETLLQKLQRKIERGMVFNNACVTNVHYEGESIKTTIYRDDEFEVFRSSAVVMALPPRLAVSSIRFSPVLSAQRMTELAALETWMAGQAKAVILYETPFWRELGFSGDAVSHEGPMREIHDASPAEGGPYALFGFINILPRQRQHNYDLLKVSVQEQLVKLFGPQASLAIRILIKDWAFEPLTSTDQDLNLQDYHPMNTISNVVEEDFDKRIIWSGTETSGYGVNGYLEGALESSARSVKILTDLF